MAIDIYVGMSGGAYVRCLWSAARVQECLESIVWFNVCVWGTVHCTLWQRREMDGCCSEMVSTVSYSVANNAQVKVEVQVRKLEERLGYKRMCGCPLLC